MDPHKICCPTCRRHLITKRRNKFCSVKCKQEFKSALREKKSQANPKN